MRIVGLRRLLGSTLALAIAGAIAPAVASASVVYNVNTTADANLSNPSSKNCVAAVETPKKCTLRAAIQAADNQPNSTSVTINVPAGHYVLTVMDPTATATYLYVNNSGPLDIVGAGASSTTVDANFTDRAFFLTNGGVTISGLTIENGRSGGLGHVSSCPSPGSFSGPPDGGGIYQLNGSLMLQDDVISGNIANGYGGGIFNEGPGALTLAGVTVSHNTSCNNSSGPRAGGGIDSYEGGLLTIRGSTISDNTAHNGNGGGIAETESSGTTKIYNTTISGNHAFDGGGIEASAPGTFLLFGDLLSGNQATNFGGGFDNSGSNTDTFINTTITGNSAPSGGGGIETGTIFSDSGPLTAETISFSTLDGNTSSSGSGNIDNSAGECTPQLSVSSPSQCGGATVDDSIVVRGGGGNCSLGSVVSLGHNVFDDTADHGTQCGATSSDIVTASPKVAGLADNGGQTQTEALLPGSPAVDAANVARCTSETKNPSGDMVDQRGFVPRPQGIRCDIGAFEATPNLGVTASPEQNSILVGKQDTVTDVINNSGPTDALNSTFTDPGAGYQIDSVATSQGTCTHTATTVSCQLGTIVSGGKVTITIVLTGLTPGLISLVSHTATSDLDLDQANNQAAVGIDVKSIPPPPPPPPPKPRPSIGLAKLGPACYPPHSMITIKATARAVAAIRTVTVKLGGKKIGFYRSHPVAPTVKRITLRVNASGLRTGHTYPVSATVVDLLGRSAHASSRLTVCKPKPKRGFTG
jgi:CSLREA domain-containing protein